MYTCKCKIDLIFSFYLSCRCFGILMAVGQDLPRNKLHLLDNAVRNIEETCYTHIYLHSILYLLSLSLFSLQQVSTNSLPECSIFTVSGFWDTSLPSLAILNEDTSKCQLMSFTNVQYMLVSYTFIIHNIYTVYVSV